MAAATEAAVDLVVDDLDCDIFIDFDVIQALDLDLSSSASASAEFHGTTACCSAIFSDADIVSNCRHGCEDDDGDSGAAAAACRWLLAGLVGDVDACSVDRAEEKEAGSSSPADSGVTDDGPRAPAAGDDDAAAEASMSAYVAELQRFLLDDDAPCREQAEYVLGVVDDYFAGDQLLLATAEVVVPAAGRVELTADADGEE